MNTKELLNSLENEIKTMQNDAAKQAALMRVQEMAKNYEGEDKVVSSLDLYQDLKDNPPAPGLPTGIAGLDQILGGLSTKHLVVLSGVTKHGKTSLALYIANQMGSEKPMMLLFEESAQELILKYIDRDQEPPLFYTPQRVKDRTLSWIESKIVESKAKYGSKVIFIDHLEFIRPERAQRQSNDFSRTNELDSIVYAIKELAQKWNVVVVLLCHLVKAEIDKHPNLQDLRGTAAIAQVADTVMFIWRETKKDRKTGAITITNLTNLSVQANRRTGKTGNIKLVYGDGRYVEEDWKYNAMMMGEDIPENKW